MKRYTNRWALICLPALLIAVLIAVSFVFLSCSGGQEYTIEVSVETAAGQNSPFVPTSGVNVALHIMPSDSTINRYTNDDGLVRFSKIRLSDQNSLKLEVFDIVRSIDVSTLLPNETNVLPAIQKRFAAAPQVWSLGLEYRDSQDRPVSEADVLIRSDEGVILAQSVTDTQGRWSGDAEVPVGHGVEIVCDGMVRSIAADELREPQSRNLRFTKQLPVARHLVVHAYDLQQGDLVGLDVTAYRGQQRVARATTDDYGKAAIMLEGMPGEEFSIRCEGFSVPRSYQIDPDEEEPGTIRFHRVPTVEGSYAIVVKGGGQGVKEVPLADVAVDATRDGNRVPCGTTDSQGRLAWTGTFPFKSLLRFTAALNDYRLRLPVALEHSDQMQNVDLFMVYAPDTTQVTFRILDNETGRLVDDAHGRVGDGPEQRIKPDKPGQLVFHGIHRQRQATLRVVAGPVIKSFAFTPPATGAVSYDVRISQFGDVTLHVHGAESKMANLSGAEVYAVANGQKDAYLGNTDAQGNLTLHQRYGLTRYYIDPMSPQYTSVLSDGIVFNQNGQVFEIGVPRGDPLEQCRDCIADLNAASSSGSSAEEVGRLLRSLLIRCPSRNYATESPQTKLEVWQDALSALIQFYERQPDDVAVPDAMKTLEMLVEHDLPNAERCIYYAYQAWFLVTLLQRDEANVELVEQSLQNLEYAITYFDDLVSSRPNYSSCIKAYLEYLQGRTKYLKAKILLDQGMPDESLMHGSRVHMETYLHYINGNQQCQWPDSWRSRAEYVVELVRGMEE